MDVLEQLHRRLPAGDGLGRVDKGAQRLVLEFLRRHRDGPVALLARDREHRGDEPDIFARPAVLADDQRFELVELLLRRVVAREAQGPLEVVDDRVERAVDIIGRGMQAQAGRVLRLDPAAQFAEDAALADARLARQQHHLAFAVLRQVPALHQQAEFVLAADKTGQPAAPHRFEAALGCRHPRDRPGLDRLGETLDLVPAERAQLEPIANQPARGRGDHHRGGLGQRLQSRGQVRRLADHRLLLCGTFADEIADHDQPGGDADADLELAASGCVEPSDIGADVEAGAHRALGIVFVGARIAEINQHAVAHVFGDEPVEAAHRFRCAAVIGADHLAQLLGIEPRCHRRRADQIAEHHRQLPALRRRAGCGLRCRDVCSITKPGAKGGNRFQHRAAMTNRGDAEILQIIGGQARQQFGADVVLLEGGRILLEPQRPQPLGNVQLRLPRQQAAG